MLRLTSKRNLTKWLAELQTARKERSSFQFVLLLDQIAIDPVHPLVVYLLTFTAQQHMQTPIAEARLLASRRDQMLPQAIVVLPRLVAITLDRDQ